MNSESEVKGVGEQGVGVHVRTDFFMRDVINQAVAAIPALGLQRTAEFLSSMNVPPEVAIRVLSYPSKRQH